MKCDPIPSVDVLLEPTTLNQLYHSIRFDCIGLQSMALAQVSSKMQQQLEIDVRFQAELIV